MNMVAPSFRGLMAEGWEAIALSTPSPPAIPLSPFLFNRFPLHFLCRLFLSIRYF